MLPLGRGLSKTWSNSHSLSQHVCAKHHTIQTLDLVGEEARTYRLSTYFPLHVIENKKHDIQYFERVGSSQNNIGHLST